MFFVNPLEYLRVKGALLIWRGSVEVVDRRVYEVPTRLYSASSCRAVVGPREPTRVYGPYSMQCQAYGKQLHAACKSHTILLSASEAFSLACGWAVS